MARSKSNEARGPMFWVRVAGVVVAVAGVVCTVVFQRTPPVANPVVPAQAQAPHVVVNGSGNAVFHDMEGGELTVVSTPPANSVTDPTLSVTP